MISFASMPNNCVTGAAFVPPLARPAWPTRSTRTSLSATAIRFKRTPPGLSPAQMMQSDTRWGTRHSDDQFVHVTPSFDVIFEFVRRPSVGGISCVVLVRSLTLSETPVKKSRQRIHTTRNCNLPCSRANLNIHDNIDQIK